VYSIGVFFFPVRTLLFIKEKNFYFITNLPNLARFMTKFTRFSMVTKLERNPYLLLSEANVSWAPNEVEQIRVELAFFFFFHLGWGFPSWGEGMWGRRT